MAVESTITEKSYKPGAAMAPEPLTGIKFFDADDLVVELQLDGATERTVLTRGLDYGIGGDGEAGTGTITATGSYAADDLFHIRRATGRLQRRPFPAHQPLPSKDVRDALDRLTLVAQEQDGEIVRGVQVPRGETGYELPPAAERAGGFLAHDALGRPYTSAGTGADEGLRLDLIDPDSGADQVGYRGRTAKMKLDDWRTPEDVGITGVGEGNVAIDTAALNAVAALGKKIIIPKGLDLLTDTVLGHRLFGARPFLEIEGSVTYAGTNPAIEGGYSGFFGLFSAFGTEGVTIVGGGELNGAWDGDKTPVAGRVGAAIFLSHCPQATIDGPQMLDLFEGGIKALNCPEMTVRRPSRAYHVRNIGCELRSYAANPLTAIAGSGFLGGAWAGSIYGPSGSIEMICEWIDDGLEGAGNGTGIDFSSSAGAPSCRGLRIGGRMTDCLLGVWSENNYAGSEARNIDIDVLVTGDVRGAGTVQCSDAIGLIGVLGGSVKARIIDPSNFTPGGGADTVGVNVVESADVEVDVVVSSGNGKMQYALNVSNSHGVSGRVRQTGAAVAPTIVQNGSTDVSVKVAGGVGSETWIQPTPYSFALTTIPASDTTTLNSLGIAGVDSRVLAVGGRVVALSARLSDNAPAGSSFTITCTVAGSPQPLVTLDQDDFGGGAQARSEIAVEDALQAMGGDQVAVQIQTDGTWTDRGIVVDVVVDHGMKA